MQTRPESRFDSRHALVLLLLLLAGLAAAAWASGLTSRISWATLAHHHALLAAWVDAHPLAAAALYLVVYAVVVALSLPVAGVVSVAGGLLFGTVEGGLLAVLGATAGAIVLFLVVRGALAPVLARRAAPLLARIRPGLERDGFHYLLAIRLVPVFPFWLVNLAAAACGMRLAPYAVATLLGITPPSLVFAWLGAGIGGVLEAGGRPDLGVVLSPPVLLPLLGFAGLALLPIVLRGVLRGRRSDA